MRTFKQYETIAKDLIKDCVFTSTKDINKAIAKRMIDMIEKEADLEGISWTQEKALRDKVWNKYLR